MSISTYDELKTEIQDWSARSDLASKVSDFVILTESQINKMLRDANMESTVTTELSPSDPFVTLPSDFREIRSAYIEGTPDTPLSYVSPQALIRIGADGVARTPQVFTIVGTKLKLAPVPDSNYTLEIAYFKTVPALSDSNTTNWLLTKYPDVYLAGGLSHLYRYVKSYDEASMWEAKMKDEINNIIEEAKRAVWNSAPLTPRVDIYTP